jgi:tetratricopeptide (TPR) repeat protein
MSEPSPAKDRIFSRGDWLCGALATLLALAVYAWTAAPSVTLLDSGEFLTAAQRFGVPHPTGYPLWTLLGWLFLLLPLGNAAWQLALLSGIYGAFAVGLAAMLIRSTVRWLAPEPALRPLASLSALALSLAFAFSQSMWSQAVIVEVYTLHALLIGLYLTSLYVWLRRPEQMAPLYWSVFLLALAFSNHQLALALAPLPVLVVLLVRRDLFWDLFLAAAVAALLAYLSFALLANDTQVIKASIRLSYLVATILVIALVLKRGRLRWKLIAFVPILLAAGLLPYAYSPLASSTNPPMNWGYTRTPEGFFASFNRSQYAGSLSHLSLKVFSKTLGVANERDLAEPEPPATQASPLATLQTWSAFYWEKILSSFTPFGILSFFAAFLGALRAPLPLRVWIYLSLLAFCLAMGLQPTLEHATIDNAGWWVQMPYHTYTNFIFALLAGVGAFVSFRALGGRFPRLRPLAWSLLLLPVWPLWNNFAICSQRGHWFGWEFGHDMLAPLPQGSVLFGGTDPGRFIPTYLIFGESSLPPNRRIDPQFDRRDLYLVTQNGLADQFYLPYIRDQYTTDRPPVTNAFERWLGRTHDYPRVPLILPTAREVHEISEKSGQTWKNAHPDAGAQDLTQAMHGAIAQWIFEKNKARHTFYVEESFSMPWSYDYAIPDGLIYRLSPTKVTTLPTDVVQKDFAFWTATIARLQADPHYADDYDARRSFSHLRLVGAKIYYHHKMKPEAERAYRQALDLWPAHVEPLIALSSLLWERRAFDEAIALFDRALAEDPNNAALRRYRALAEERKQAQIEIDRTLAAWRKKPTDLAALHRLVELNSHIGDTDAVDNLLREAMQKNGATPEFLQFATEVSEARNDWPSAADVAARWAAASPGSPEPYYSLARSELMLDKDPEAIKALTQAIKLGGLEYRERVIRDPIFKKLKDSPELYDLMLSAPPPAK